MNGRGDVVFAGLLVKLTNRSAGGTFLWDEAAGKLVPVALPGMPSVPGQTFEWAAGEAPAINDRNEIALVGTVQVAGRSSPGVFFRGLNGKLQPVALPDQPLPGGGKAAAASRPSLNDSGVLVCLVKRQGEEVEYPYVWENGTLRPLPVESVVPPRGRLLLGFAGAWLSNRNRNVLLAAHVHSLGGHLQGLYLLAGDKATPLALPSQEMPGGGRLWTLQDGGVSVANDAGQHAFLALLQDGSTAAYRVDVDGKLSLILRSGATTPLGKITQVGSNDGSSRGIGLNSRGEVALPVTIANGPAMIVRVTPP
jgi:hypothetical protein